MTSTGDKLRLLKNTHWGLNLVTFALIVIGVFFIHSAVHASIDYDTRFLPRKQIFWAFVGLGVYIFLVLYDYRRLRQIAWWVYGAAVFLLVLVLMVGSSASGARRWLVLFGEVTVQPSEVAKLATIITLSSVLSWHDVDRSSIKFILFLLLLICLPWLLIVVEPDLGTAMVFLPVSFLLMYAGGIPLRMLGFLASLGLVMVSIMLGVFLLPSKMGVSEEAHDRIIRSIGLSSYHRDRVVYFLNPDKDPLGAGWNKIQSEIAVGSGGVWGKGWKKGRQNILGFLPRTVTPTDFIYSVIAEEKGFFGSVCVIGLFVLLMGFGMQVAFMAKDMIGRLLCVGVVGMIFCHAFINIAMTIGLMPITGLPLPLLSYGGSFMVVTMSGLGMIQSVYVRSLPRRQVYI